MTLKKGQSAPPFQAIDMSGKDVALTDYKSKRLLLSFSAPIHPAQSR